MSDQLPSVMVPRYKLVHLYIEVPTTSRNGGEDSAAMRIASHLVDGLDDHLGHIISLSPSTSNDERYVFSLVIAGCENSFERAVESVLRYMRIDGLLNELRIA